MYENQTILVTGGTGTQGGAVARNLIARGFNVKVITRNTGSTKAMELGKLKIHVQHGDLNKPDSYRDALVGVHGVFSVQTFEKGMEEEVSQGTMLATEALKAGVRHFVYSSATGAHLNTGVPHLDSKFRIENHIREIGLPFTIIRPASFYENFLIPQVKKGILKGKLVQPINRDTVLQYICADDIGKVVTRIFSDPARYLGQTLNLSTEELTTEQVAGVFSEALNQKVTYQHLPALVTRLFMGKGLYKMFKWMDQKNQFRAEDVKATREGFPDLLDLKSWVGANFRDN